MSDRRRVCRTRSSELFAKTLLLLCLAAGVAAPFAIAEGRRPDTSLHVRQLGRPFETDPHAPCAPAVSVRTTPRAPLHRIWCG